MWPLSRAQFRGRSDTRDTHRMLDDLARFNRERWEDLARANIQYSRPALGLDPETARAMVDPEGVMGEVPGCDVLCLASGGGQQSAAFGLLGASVTVLDLCPTQLARDRQAAAHYGLNTRTLEGDMRDLSVFAAGSFDLVYHAHSINFVPDARQVFREVARVLRPEGLYRFSCHNPFVHTVWETSWDGEGYRLSDAYRDGEVTDDPYWDVDDGAGTTRRVLGPREFRHTLSTLVNGLVEAGMAVRGVWEDTGKDATAAPGTWQHLKMIAPAWLTFWAVGGARPIVSV